MYFLQKEIILYLQPGKLKNTDDGKNLRYNGQKSNGWK